MTTFLAIMLTLVVTATITFVATVTLEQWVISESANYREYLKGIIDEYDED